MKNISTQYQELKEGKMTQHQFLRNARMMFPNFVTNHNSFADSVTILKTKGLLNEGDAVKGTPDKEPTYDSPTPEASVKYKKVEQSPEVDEQDGIYPATSVKDVPKKEKTYKKVKNTSDGLEPIKDNDTKNELKKVKVVKENIEPEDIDQAEREITNNNSTIQAMADKLGISQEELFKLLLKKLGGLKEIDENIHNTVQMGGILGGRNYDAEAKEDKQAAFEIDDLIKAGVNKEEAIKKIADKYQLRPDYLNRKYNLYVLKENSDKDEMCEGVIPDLKAWMTLYNNNQNAFANELKKMELDPSTPPSLAFNRLSDKQKEKIYSNIVVNAAYSKGMKEGIDKNRSFDDVFANFVETDDATEIKSYIKEKGKEAIAKIKAKLPALKDQAKQKLIKLMKVELDEARFKKGTDIGKPGKGFEKVAKAAEKEYGSKEAGQKVAGAILKKVLNKESSIKEKLRPAIQKLVQEVLDEMGQE